jgi:hypothetical protein
MFFRAASCLGDHPVSFHIMAISIHFNVTHQRGMNQHYNQWSGRNMYDANKELKARIIDNVARPMTGLCEYRKYRTRKYAQK